MAEPPTYPDDDTADGPARTPRWVIVFGIIALVLAMLFVVLQFVGGGDHGPGRHGSGGDVDAVVISVR